MHYMEFYPKNKEKATKTAVLNKKGTFDAYYFLFCEGQNLRK